MCSLMINGQAHGPDRATTTCQLHMRRFKDGDTIVIEPWRASAFPVLRDLVVDRSAFDRIIQSGGFVSVNTGNAPDGNAFRSPDMSRKSQWTVQPVSAVVPVLRPVRMPQRCCFVQRRFRSFRFCLRDILNVRAESSIWLAQMDKEGFCSCTNTSECEAACPAEVSVTHIAR